MTPNEPRGRVSDTRPNRSPRVVRAYVQRFEPSKLDDDATAVVRRTVLLGSPQSNTEARDRLVATSDLVAFMIRQGVELDKKCRPRALINDSMLASWEQDMQHRVAAGELAESAAQSYFSRVRSLGLLLGLRGAYLHSRGHSRRQTVAPPMSDVHFVQWLAVAEAQSPIVSQRLLMHLMMCRGAGANATDERYIRGDSVVRRRDGALIIEIDGPSHRTAVMLDRYAEAFASLAARFGDQLLIGEWPHRENPASDLLVEVKGGLDLTRPLPAVLRRAYVVEMLSAGASVLDLKHQLGCKTLSEIQSAVPYATTKTFDSTPFRRGAPSDGMTAYGLPDTTSGSMP